MAKAKEDSETKKPVKKAAAKTESVVQEPASVEIQTEEEAKEIAKAGKRSAKALKEAEELKAKAARKAEKTPEEAAEAKKLAKKPPRSRVERAGKKYRELVKLIDNQKTYSLAEAVDLAIKTSPTKFDATLELHINLDVDPTQADQNVRGIVALPAGSGKTLRIAVLAEAEGEQKAKTAGADLFNSQEILGDLEKEVINFDVLIAEPQMMAKLGKFAKLLGPKGLMPNPKSGTVTKDVVKAVTEAKAGKLEYRVDSEGIIHAGLGKLSFGADKLTQNTEAVLTSVRSAKPSGLKGNYIKSIYLTTTMGPSIRIST